MLCMLLLICYLRWATQADTWTCQQPPLGGRTTPIPPAHQSFIPAFGPQPPGCDLPRNARVQLNRLRTGVARFAANMKLISLCGSDLCECGKVQTAHHILHDCTKLKPPCHINEVDNPAILEYLTQSKFCIRRKNANRWWCQSQPMMMSEPTDDDVRANRLQTYFAVFTLQSCKSCASHWKVPKVKYHWLHVYLWQAREEVGFLDFLRIATKSLMYICGFPWKVFVWPTLFNT